MEVLLTEAQKGAGDETHTEWDEIECCAFLQEGGGAMLFIIGTWTFPVGQDI